MERDNWPLLTAFLGLSISIGLFIVPLYTQLQQTSDRRFIARIIAANNILNSKLITGGFQQARIPYDDNAVTGNVYKFPTKYYYALGANYFATISYKF